MPEITENNIKNNLSPGADTGEGWKRVSAHISENFGREATLEAALMLIGIRELGRVQEKFSKEEKQDLIHAGICSILSAGGYFEFKGKDADGWPHWEAVRPVPKSTAGEQEVFLKQYVIRYFDEMLS